MNDEKIFDRIEKKYLISSEQMGKILAGAGRRLKPDQYFKSEIFNIYFDTKNYDLIIKSIENPNFKEKLRARAYGGYDKVFMEIKTKLKEHGTKVGYKRRFLLTHKEYKKLAAKEKTALELAKNSIETPTDLQIAKEVDYLINYFDLKPKILIYYDRKSYAGKNGLRITFDENLSFRETDLNFRRKVHDRHYFKDRKNIIMEVKARGAMPLWFSHLLAENKIFPGRFSKIGKVYELIKKEAYNV